MSITIDKERCTRCGRCVTVCAPGALGMSDTSAAAVKPELCILCGHCVSICPEEAVSAEIERDNPRLFSVRDHEIPHTPQEWRKATGSLLRNKRSVREFTADTVSSETLRDLIIHGDAAPSSHNFRGRKFFVITDQSAIRDLEARIVLSYKRLLPVLNPVTLGLVSLFSKETGSALRELRDSFISLHRELKSGGTPIFRGAPCVICIAGPKGNTQARDDVIAAQHYMMIYGETLGLGSCIIGFAQHAHKLVEKFLREYTRNGDTDTLPAGYSVHGVSIFGFTHTSYPKEIVHGEPAVGWIV